ncbi:MAG TPA: hypothetical protein VN428_10005 [Bryobacteraceae bacterium]|nr:hypothetical protein [Bryobacteraceae bacterium]
MWMHAAEVANAPLAIAIGFVFGVWARRSGLSPWSAYALALIPGVLLAGVSHYWFGQDVKTLPDALVWMTWTAFGIFSGWHKVRKPNASHTLNLSGREPRGLG